MAIKVGMVSLGCPKNQVDAELMMADIRKAGYELCEDAALADVAVINTCGFIESAKAESIEFILEFTTLKEEGRIKAVIITGCLAERYREEVAREIPEADAVLGIGSNKDIVAAIEKALAGEKTLSFGPKEDLPLSGDRILSTIPFYAYLKIAEGCDNRCSYCAIPGIRGGFRSRPMEDILKEAATLAEWGVEELVVVAQDTTRYGEDLYGKPALAKLLEELCRIDGFRWIRVLYAYPHRITDELIDVMAREEKICKYLDLPMQHVNGEILRRMNRPGDEQTLSELVEKLRQRVPGIVLRTTFMTGFPGETEEQFEQLCAFVAKHKLERVGCFAYSAEEDTPAAEFPDQVEEEVKARRCELLYQLCEEMMQEKNAALEGQTLLCVTEGFDRYTECYFGRSAADAPDIDGKVFFKSSQKLRLGQFVSVLVDEVVDGEPFGTAIF